jgi:hypothetical protein
MAKSRIENDNFNVGRMVEHFMVYYLFFILYNEHYFTRKYLLNMLNWMTSTR